MSARLHLITNLWTLWDHPTAKREWSLERKIAAIKEAGFDGFTYLLDRKHGRLAAKHGLQTIGYISSANPKDFARLVGQNLEGGAQRINVQLGNHDTTTPEATRLAVAIIAEGERQGVPCDIEMHRDTCTETPEKTYALADAYRRVTGRLLPITWDFSHFAVVKHLAPPYWERLIAKPELIRHSRQFHFRPFNGHHCQVPVTDSSGRLSVEFRQWVPTMEKIIAVWLEGDQDDAEVFACPEMGPVRGGYNLAQLPRSWDDTKRLGPIIRRTWNRLLREHAARPAKRSRAGRK